MSVPVANLDLISSGLGRSLASISSMPTSWNWSYQLASSGHVADVAYDMWLSNNAASKGASSDSTYEVSVVKLISHVHPADAIHNLA